MSAKDKRSSLTSKIISRVLLPLKWGDGSLEALKAQAVASRTLAARYEGKTITDQSSKHQAFRASRMDWKRASQAVESTAGEVLIYSGKLLDTAAFSASNGGETKPSAERWGGERPYLIRRLTRGTKRRARSGETPGAQCEPDTALE